MRLLTNPAAFRVIAALVVVVVDTAGQSTLPAQFGTATVQQLPLAPVAMEPLIADFNGDGVLDIARPCSVPPGIQCMLGPTWSIPIISPSGVSQADGGVPLKAVDLNADGFLDIVAYSGNGIRNFLSNGNGTFFPGALSPGMPWYDISAIDVADFDLDGNPDLAATRGVPGSTKGALTIYRNVTGVWVGAITIPMTFVSSDLSVGDVDGDGRDDIVLMVAGFTSLAGTAAVFRNIGPGYVFQLTGNFPHGPCYMGRVGDIDGDGCADLLTALHVGGLGFSRGTPSATMLPPQVVYPPPFPGANFGVHSDNFPIIRDFDRDGRGDVLMPLVPMSSVTVNPYTLVLHLAGYLFLCRGTSLSTTPVVLNFGPGNGRGSIGAGDMDGDGDQDLVYATDQSTVPMGGPADQGIVPNLSIFGRGLPGASGVPGFQVGSAVPGNPAFSLRLVSARPNAVALLGLSTASGMIGTPAGALWLDLGPGALLSPTPTFGAFTTNAMGAATVTFSLPSGTALQGTSFFAQWAVSDPAGQTLQGLGPLALSDARKIVLWP